ncbi:MAG: tetratricopeptide repeat protein [Acidobacteria bacterium]|nr:tetratricopeptide repeat protein [Acidobacteriota bacterium]
MKFKLTILLLLFALVPALAQNDHERGLQMMKEKNYKGALAAFDESIATHPDWYFPTLMKAKCQMALEQYRDAISTYSEALGMETPAKDQLVAKFDMARAHLALEEYLNAIKLFNELVDLVPANKKFDIYFQKGQAEFQYGRSSANKGDNSASFNYFSKAIASFTEALKYPSTSQKFKVEATFQKAYAQYEIGNVQGTEKSLSDCLQQFEKVLQDDPRHRQTHDFLVDVSFKLVNIAKNDNEKANAYQKALNYSDKALQAFPNDPKMTYRKGQALQGLKRYDEAVGVLKKYCSLKPSDGEGWFHLASSEMAAKKYTDALGSFNKAIANGQRSDANVYTFMAYCYQEQKTGCYKTDIPMLTKSVEILQQGLKATSNNAQVKRDLDAKQNNLEILKENQRTDEENRKNFVANIKSLDDNIAINEQKLIANRERYLATPTPELKAAIDEGEKQLKNAKADLAEQLKELKTSYEDAKKCGGSDASIHFADMTATLKGHGII